MVQDWRLKVWDLRLRFWDLRFESSGLEIWGLRFDAWGFWALWGLRFEIWDVEDWRFEVWVKLPGFLEAVGLKLQRILNQFLFKSALKILSALLKKNWGLRVEIWGFVEHLRSLILDSNLGKISSNFTKIIQKFAEMRRKINERRFVNFTASTFTYFGVKI